MYTKEQIINSIKRNQMLYQKDEINYTGKTKPLHKTSTYYSEVISEYLLSRLDNPKEIQKTLQLWNMDVRKNFQFNNHDGTIEKETNRREEILCKKLYNLCKKSDVSLKNLGHIINYQVNLIENTKVNIDLVSTIDQKIYIIEVKGHLDSNIGISSSETLLRCMLEIESYYRFLLNNQDDFFKTLSSKDYNNLLNRIITPVIEKAILVSKSTQAWIEYQEINTPERIKLKALLDKLMIKVYCIENEISPHSLD